MNVVVLFRNAPVLAEKCLRSLQADAKRDRAYLLIDDCSDPQQKVLPQLEDFRRAVAPAPVRIVRFRRQMHYGHGLAYGLSLARGADVLFISHDMMLTPDCVSEMIELLRGDQKIGIARPTSPHMDWAKSFVTTPPGSPATLDNIVSFSRIVRQQHGNEAVDWPMLIGDAMLIRREVIEKIGVFDTRFYGFMGDIDFGVRARRAGFGHVIARGAWLHHEGAGTAKESSDAQAKGEGMLKLVESAYEQFRAKWGAQHLPPYFRDMRREHFEALHALPPMSADAPVPPLQLTDDIGELV